MASTPSRRLAVPLLSGLFLLAGCGEPEAPVGSASVSIKYGGAPVTKGSVNLTGTNGGAGGSIVLTETGTVKFEELPVGSYKVFVFPPEMAAPEPDPVKGGFKSMVPPDDIPRIFHSETSSPITIDIKEGENSFEFDLKELDTTKKP